MFRVTILSFFAVIFMAGCNNNADVVIKYVDNDPLYFDYKIWGEEDRNYVTVMLQYRLETGAGFTRVLKNPSKVEFDGNLLVADSSKMSGFFYERETPLDSFSGRHLITYTDTAGKKYEETFDFTPFSLKVELPDKVSRNGFEIQLEGLEKKDFIRIIALDTAFKSRGINEVDTISNGLIIVTRDKLKNLVNGTIHLELFKEQEWPVKNATSAGGYISITYGLKREFQLID